MCLQITIFNAHLQTLGNFLGAGSFRKPLGIPFVVQVLIFRTILTCYEMQIPLLCKIVPRQQKAAKAVAVIRETVERLVAQCKEMVDAEKETLQGEEYVNESDPSVLRFLLASREEVVITAPVLVN